MRRYFTEPGDARGFGGGGGVEAFGDGVGDDGLAFLGEQFDEPLLLADQLVDLRGLAVKEGNDTRPDLRRAVRRNVSSLEIGRRTVGLSSAFSRVCNPNASRRCFRAKNVPIEPGSVAECEGAE